jgi:hypothetical protein
MFKMDDELLEGFRKISEDEAEGVLDATADILYYISKKLPKLEGTKEFDLMLNMLCSCVVVFMQKTVEPEKYHSLIEIFTYNLRRNADHVINKFKERDASQSTDHKN